MLLFILICYFSKADMDWTARHYGYHEDPLSSWTEFPYWLNQSYYEKGKNTTDQDKLLMRARLQITKDIMQIITSGSRTKQYAWSQYMRQLVPGNIITLGKELQERFNLVEFQVRIQLGGGISSKYINIGDYDPLTQEKPTLIRITFE